MLVKCFFGKQALSVPFPALQTQHLPLFNSRNLDVEDAIIRMEYLGTKVDKERKRQLLCTR